MATYATPPRSGDERCNVVKEGQNIQSSVSATPTPNPLQQLPPTPISEKPSTHREEPSTVPGSPSQSKTTDPNVTGEEENLESLPVLETTTTPWNGIIQAFTQSLPTNPFHPYINVPVFDETARNGIFTKAYQKDGFNYADKSGTYTANIRIFTIKKALLNNRYRRPGTGAPMVWYYEVGVCAVLIMRHGRESLVYGEEEIMTLNYPIYARSKMQDPTWGDVVQRLQSATYLPYGVPVTLPQQPQPEQQKQPVEVPKSQLQLRTMAIPKTRKPGPPKPVSTTTPPPPPPAPATPATLATPTLAPKQSRQGLLPLSAVTIAYYESARKEVTLPVAPSPARAPPPKAGATLPRPRPSLIPAAAYYESLRKGGAAPKPLPPLSRLPLPSLPSLPPMATMPAYFESLMREVERRKRKAVGVRGWMGLLLPRRGLWGDVELVRGMGGWKRVRRFDREIHRNAK
ncbi:hypothetical protein BKA65DRAFT_573742 [Rhexocercosporidium sp. MPI-PUGE-AT-0058]|nr:hypothetical protein BKA65DRAFT_573742 [Rhexocercosporidium sp. MPI-PUGE-AT-0058]